MRNITQAADYKSNIYFLLAFGLINILGFTLLLCTVGLLVGITISWWQFPVACIIALVANYYASNFLLGKSAKAAFYKNSALIIALLAGTILVAGAIYDLSFDGQWYHQETVYSLKHGYNPVYQALDVPPGEQSIDNSNNWCEGADIRSPAVKQNSIIPVNLKFLNINHFSKGTEAIESAIYQVTGHIETGKAVNGIMLIASFFLALALLYKVDGIGVTTKWLLAIVLAFNPVTVKELCTFCVDGFGASLLLCMMLIFCLVLLQQNKYYYYLFASVIILVVNVKFTMLVFADMYIFGFLLIILIFKKTVILKNMLVTASFAVAIGVFICGFNPYVTNMVRKHNIFYGLNETRDEIKRMTPKPFLPLNSFETLFLSLSSHQGWDAANNNTVSQMPKIPFTFNKTDILDSTEDEPSISGFGPFFSGALLVAITILFIAIVRSRKTMAFKYAVSAVLLVLVTVLIIPDPWWLRFIPQLWLVPVIVLVMVEYLEFKAKKPVKSILYVSLLLNVAWSLLIFVFWILNTSRMDYQLQQVKALNKPVNMEFCNYRCFKSNKVRFEEAGIIVTDRPLITGKTYDIAYSSTKFRTSSPLPDLPKGFILKIAEKMSRK